MASEAGDVPGANLPADGRDGDCTRLAKVGGRLPDRDHVLERRRAANGVTWAESGEPYKGSITKS